MLEKKKQYRRAFLAPAMVAFSLFNLFSSHGQAAPPPSVSLTLLHTNDLHSHFRAEKTPLGLGGVARLKTAVTAARASAEHSLLVDGGDWSEGNIYYTEGVGREAIRMMEHIGYDVAVVGNHDWINGPDNLIRVLKDADGTLSKMSMIASNLKVDDYENADELRRAIPPYVIRQVGNARVAFIGVLTYEFIYDKFFKPVKITEPYATTRELARRLKKVVDAVVVISHNTNATNARILKAAPDVDLMIGAHDHVQLNEPIIVKRLGAKPAWIVETGCWGRNLGRVELKITPRDPADRKSKPAVELVSYTLQQMDKTVAEDPATLSRIAALETVIEAKRGPIFHDHIGETQVELERLGMESLMGNFTTDALKKAVNADFALDHSKFIYGEIHRGVIDSADVYDSNPGVFNLKTDKAWTLHVLPIRGRSIAWLLNLMYSSKALTQHGGVAFSGVELLINPLLAPKPPKPATQQNDDLADEPALAGGTDVTLQDAVPGIPDPFTSTMAFPTLANGIPANLFIKSFKINGEEMQPDKVYKLAAPGGVIEAIEFLDNLIPNAIPLTGLQDTGVEDWRVMANYLHSISPVTHEKIGYGDRIRTVQSDLGVLEDDIRWVPQGRDSQGRMKATIYVKVRNTGSLPSAGFVSLALNEWGADYTHDPKYRVVGGPQPTSILLPGGESEVSWEGIAIPESRGVFAVSAFVTGTEFEVNHTNDKTTRHFTRLDVR